MPKFRKVFPAADSYYQDRTWRNAFELSMVDQTVGEARIRGHRVLEGRDYTTRWTPNGEDWYLVVEVEVLYDSASGGTASPKC